MSDPAKKDITITNRAVLLIALVSLVGVCAGDPVGGIYFLLLAVWIDGGQKWNDWKKRRAEGLGE